MNFAFAGGRGDAWAEMAVFLNPLIFGAGQEDFTAAFEIGYGIRDGAIDGLGQFPVVVAGRLAATRRASSHVDGDFGDEIC